MSPSRCHWCGTDPIYVAYHDTEWGVPEHDDRALFEKLLLDGFQAGLSWIIILRKRAAFRAAFAGFEPTRLSRFGAADVARLMADAGIVRNRRKIEAAIASACATVRLADAGQPLNTALWRFTDGRVLQPGHPTASTVPTESPESRAMAKWLKAEGFAFCGPTVCYAFMQAVGMINDHVRSCFRHAQLAGPVAARGPLH